MKNYGNSFNAESAGPVSIGRRSLWKSAREFYPGGAYWKVSEEEGITPGSTIPAGMPVSVDKPGGTPNFNPANPDGLVYEDVCLGTDGATVTICTRGEIMLKRISNEVRISDAQKAHLFGRITFINA